MDFDLPVFGGGMAGIGAAKAAADLGATVAPADHGKLGGDDLRNAIDQATSDVVHHTPKRGGG